MFNLFNQHKAAGSCSGNMCIQVPSSPQCSLYARAYVRMHTHTHTQDGPAAEHAVSHRISWSGLDRRTDGDRLIDQLTDRLTD